MSQNVIIAQQVQIHPLEQITWETAINGWQSALDIPAHVTTPEIGLGASLLSAQRRMV
jgi:hypothetical protein